MPLYTARQLLILFALLAAAAIGLAVREWRAVHSELADRLEQVDRQPELAPAPESARPPAADHSPIDLNQATADELARLPGVGPSLAARILEHRTTAGAFASIDDLRRVKGIGPAKLERLRHLVTIAQ
jgi:competence protein ComEA